MEGGGGERETLGDIEGEEREDIERDRQRGGRLREREGGGGEGDRKTERYREGKRERGRESGGGRGGWRKRR